MSIMTLDRTDEVLTALRRKWGTVPGAGPDRVTTADLLAMDDDKLVATWWRIVHAATTAQNQCVRGWYHTLYKDVLRDKKVIDVGSGLGIDGISFALAGARMTFLDIVTENLELMRRLCDLLGIHDARFCYLHTLEAIDELDTDYDVVWAQGSLINAPFDVTRAEAAALLRRLPVGGRWIELAYPRERWEREGSLPFDQWGRKTDGPGTPWVEWYDLDKLRALLAPAQFDTVLGFNFHHDDFNWFDLIRRA